MSLNVDDQIVAAVEAGSLQNGDFVSLVQRSLPRAWAIVLDLIERLNQGQSRLVSFGREPMDDQTRGELLRMMAGTAIRTSLEEHFGVKFAFQNCHNVAVVREGDEKSEEYKDFTSKEEQIKGQKPEFQHC